MKVECHDKSGRFRMAAFLFVVLPFLWASPACAQSSAVGSVLPKTVKIVGSGGMRGLEAYQSGIVVSSEGHILTAWSYVLDSDSIVTTNDGERFRCKLLGYDAKLEIAILKIDAQGLPHVDLAGSVDPSVGTPVLAFCNCYGVCLLYTSPSPRDKRQSRMPSSA